MNKIGLVISVMIYLSVKTMVGQTVGGDKDKHGCRISAGYTFSIIKNECVRVFEQQIQLSEVNPTGTSSSISAVIFSEDKKRAEVFIPGSKAGVILSRKGKEGSYVWKKGKISLVPKGKGYTLLKATKAIFSSEGS